MAAHDHDPVDLVLERLRSAGCNPRASGPNSWSAKCPNLDAHKGGDRNPSLSVGSSPTGNALVYCHRGRSVRDVTDALHLTMRDLFPAKPPKVAHIDERGRWKAVYSYYDADGAVDPRPPDRRRGPRPSLEETSMTDVLDGFCGVGVGLGLAELGLTEHGIDSEPSVAETRERLGMSTTLADITTLDPHDWAGVEGAWFSPPCTDYSRAGKGLGLEGPTGQLVFEPIRWVESIRPRWVAMEQVPEARDAFRAMARHLEGLGYRACVVRLSAEEYGVPQTRERVYLLAHRDRAPVVPTPTHQQYHPRRPRVEPCDMAGLLPWVSMAEALGLDEGLTVDTRCAFDGVPVTRSADSPALTVTSKIGGQWVFTRPATPAGHHDRQMDGAIKLTTVQGCTLQGFPDPARVAAALPSSKRKAWQIIGNAVASPMATRIVEGLL